MSKKVLIIDDEPDFAATVQTNLERAGYDADTAYDAFEGMKKIEKERPDAIVLDVMMPEKDGYELCSELKNDDRYSEIPVVLLTAVASHVPSTRYSHLDAMDLEADDYIAKPASAEQIIQSLANLFGSED